MFYSVFMVYAVCLPVLRVEWNMSAMQAGSVAGGFSFGYALSLLVFSWLADHLGAKRVFLASAFLSAASALAFGIFARSYESGLALYTLAALTQGGLYTPAIMLLAERYEPARRGTAVGWLLASNALGQAVSVLIAGTALSWGDYGLAFIVASCLPALGVVITWLGLRGTANVVRARPRGARLGSILLGNANVRRLIVGYTFHSWEALGIWAWLPAFFAASLAMSGSALVEAAQFGAYLTAAMYLVASVASWSMGSLSDRLDRRTILLALGATGAALSLVFGWLIALPMVVLFTVGLLYNFAVFGDSPVFSTALTEEVELAYLGSVLALRAMLGFTAGAVARVVFGMILDATNAPGAAPDVWGWAFMSLGCGGLVATWCAFRFRPASAPGASA